MRPSKPTLVAGVPVVLLWVVMTSMLWDTQRVTPHQGSLDLGQRLEQPTDSWMALLAGREQGASRIGYIHLQQIPETREQLEGVRMELAVHMALTMFGRVTELDLTGSTWRPWQGMQAEFQFEVRSGASNFQVAGRIEDGRMTGEVRSAGETIALDLPLSDNALFSSGFGASMTFPSLEIGDQIKIDSFDPMTLRASKATVRCVARQDLQIGSESVPTSVLLIESSGLETRAWVDELGEVVRAETPLGLTLQRTTAEDALAPILESGQTGELLQLTSIRPTGAKPFRGAREMSFSVSGDLPGRGLPEDSTQVRIGASNTFQIKHNPAAADHPPDSLSPYLRSDAFVQSEHAKIQQQASEILAEVGQDPRQRALALERWVFEAIDKRAVLSIPSALEVLEQRQGDCNEHAVLYTALARASGLPTRIAIGVVWSELFQGFYYHAWPEVWLEDRWHWLDPTLGQPIADATHVKLLNGGIESWPQLLPYLGKLQIDVHEIR